MRLVLISTPDGPGHHDRGRSGHVITCFEPNNRESTDLSAEESLLKTIERNLSAGRSSSKKNLQTEDSTSTLSKSKTPENNEDDGEAENERRKKGMKKIEDNNLKLDDLHEHIKNIRAETEEIRRENAKMFHIYKEGFIRIILGRFCTFYSDRINLRKNQC